MKKRMLTFGVLLTSAVAFASLPVVSQDISRGTDSELFLNPFIESALKEVSGQVVVDVGCGLAPHAAMRTNIHVVSQDQYQTTDFSDHFCEIANTMKEGEHLMIAAPASYGVIFTDGSRPEEAAYQHIAQVLSKIGKSEDPAVITQNLSGLDEVLRATFVFKNESLQLVTDEKDLQPGQQIWCKIPGGVISSIYHSEEEYLIAIKRAGLICEEIKRPCFFGKVKYDMWRASPHVCGKSLGEAYMNNNPFTIYYAVK